MNRYIIILILLIFYNISLSANECCYNFLGITANKSKKIVKIQNYKNSINIKKIVSKTKNKNSISKLLKHTKVKKISKNTTLYGVGTEYKLSKKVQLSLDILAKVDKNRDSITIQEKTAQVKIALSI